MNKGTDYRSFRGISGSTYDVYFEPIEFLNNEWLLLAMQQDSELLAPVTQAKQAAAITSLALLVLTTAISFGVAHSLSKPLGQVRDAVTDVSAGNYAAEIPAKNRKDEIGQIAQSLEEFRVKLETADHNAREVAFKSAAFEVSGAPTLMTDLEFNITHGNKSLFRLMQDRAEDFKSVAKDFDPDDLMGKNMGCFPCGSHACTQDFKPAGKSAA